MKIKNKVKAYCEACHKPIKKKEDQLCKSCVKEMWKVIDENEKNKTQIYFT